jgi:peroxiredoxin Q/BCP
LCNLEREDLMMMGTMGRRLAMLGLSVLTVMIIAGAAAAELKVGDPAPPFSLKGSDGQTYTLEQFKGKSAVVIAWFPKAFTGGCTKECKSLRENSKALHDLKVAYFTASVDTPDQNEKFAKSLDLDYPILSDPEKTVAKEYGVLNPERGFANRWTFYIDKEGIIKEIDKKVNAPQAGPDIAAKLKELGLVTE